MAGHTITEHAMALHVESGHQGAHAAHQYGLTKGENLPLVAYRAARLKCTVCTKLAPVALALATGSVRRGHLPCSEWQIDYIGLLPPSRSWLYALAAVDTYMGLLFVHPCKHADAAATMTALTQLSERYGVPLAIQSDQGTHFTAQRVRDWAADLRVTWTFHMPYTPTASGLIERMNGLLKEQIRKLTPTNTLKGWGEVVHRAVFFLNNRAVGSTTPYERLRLAPEQGVVIRVRQASLPAQVQVEGHRVVLLAGTPETVAPLTTAEPWAGADVLECTPEILFAVNTRVSGLSWVPTYWSVPGPPLAELRCYNHTDQPVVWEVGQPLAEPVPVTPTTAHIECTPAPATSAPLISSWCRGAPSGAIQAVTILAEGSGTAVVLPEGEDSPQCVSSRRLTLRTL
ncbi:uncharacterized protein LOC142017511 [Carettochelys insculpta]|uniref:uncharacterized protein LOC142017511 n=1 Tax=Carettochelys insculpta TaxID=44489 RepID=UPI003EBC33C1